MSKCNKDYTIYTIDKRMIMKQKNKKAFTLIGLVAVLVILAILALIVTPIVLNIIKRA